MDFIGFTGTRHGMTPKQKSATYGALWLLRRTAPDSRIGIRHGMCLGADAEFHAIVHDEGLFIVGHPSDVVALAANLSIGNLRPAKPPLDRNRDIVTESRAMIAAPCEAQEQTRGGTWSTIRETRRQGKPLAICMPDGTIVLERFGTWMSWP